MQIFNNLSYTFDEFKELLVLTTKDIRTSTNKEGIFPEYTMKLGYEILRRNHDVTNINRTFLGKLMIIYDSVLEPEIFDRFNINEYTEDQVKTLLSELTILDESLILNNPSGFYNYLYNLESLSDPHSYIKRLEKDRMGLAYMPIKLFEFMDKYETFLNKCNKVILDTSMNDSLWEKFITDNTEELFSSYAIHESGENNMNRMVSTSLKKFMILLGTTNLNYLPVGEFLESIKRRSRFMNKTLSDFSEKLSTPLALISTDKLFGSVIYTNALRLIVPLILNGDSDAFIEKAVQYNSNFRSIDNNVIVKHPSETNVNVHREIIYQLLGEDKYNEMVKLIFEQWESLPAARIRTLFRRLHSDELFETYVLFDIEEEFNKLADDRLKRYFLSESIRHM